MFSETVTYSSSGLADVYLLAKGAFYATDNIGGSACEAVGDFDRSFRSRYIVCVVNERPSFGIFCVCS